MGGGAADEFGIGRRKASPRARLRLLRQRLATRPDTEHEMMLNRIVIVCIALTYLSVSHWLGFAEATVALAYGLVLCAVFLTASLVLFAHIVWRPGVSHVRRHVALLLDMTTLSIGMHVGDSAFALGYPIYLWIIFGNGFRFGVRYLATAAAAAVIGFTAVISTTPIWLRDFDLSMGLMFGLIVLPAYVAALIRKLSEAKLQAEAANKAKSLFLASVSHELRTPLNAIITLSDLLKGGRHNREQHDMAATIGDSGRSLLKLINDILDLSRIEAGKQTVRLGDFHLVDLLGQTRRVLGVQAAKKGLDLKIMVGPNVPAALHGPAQDLEQVLTNLIGNAIKFTETGGVTIGITLQAPPGADDAEGDWDSDERRGASDPNVTLAFTVTDTGIGMTAEALERIFDSFTQADDSIIDRFGGTGLGLSIVKQLVERNGGTISVTSRPGEGSCFTFTMPLARLALEGAEDQAGMRAIVVTHNPVLPILIGQTGAQVRRAATAAALTAALAEWSDPASDPIVLIDLDTLGKAALGNLTAVLSEQEGQVVTGFLSAEAKGWPHNAPLPFAFAIPTPVSTMDWLKLGRAARRMGTDVQESRGAFRSLRILVAEDNRTNQAVARKLLERDGHSVTIVDNGELAVEALEKGGFDLVLMDINMPVMNGFEATKLHRFAALGRPRVPIYALTADVTAETRARAIEAGMDGCLHKPIDMPELDAVIRRVGGAPSAAGEGALADMAALPALPEEETPLNFAEIPVLDGAAISNLESLGGVEFVADLTTQFAQDARRHLDRLGAAIADCDTHEFREIAHSLRSSAANVGARRLFAQCLDWRAASAEQLATEGDEWLARLHATLVETEAAISLLVTAGKDAARRLA